MTGNLVGQIRSFIIVLYNRGSAERGVFSLPVSVVAPFANRLLKEGLPEKERTVREPWYTVLPHYRGDPPLQRAAYPVGLTSLVGQRYLPEEEPPPRVTLHPDAAVRYFTVGLQEFRTEFYRGEYKVDDLFRAGAEYLARAWIEKGEVSAEEGPFYYAVLPSSEEVLTMDPELFPREAYQVEGVFQLPPLAPNRTRTRFTRVPPPPLPERDPAGYGPTQILGRGERAPNRILIPASLYRALREEVVLSDTVEDGGYLFGQPYRLPGSPAEEDAPEFRWLLEITDFVPAEGAWGRPALLLFTGDSWSRAMRRRDTDYPDKKLVAWLHTHLFAASDEFGLSSLDQDLHRRHLSKPWQVAVLLNIDAAGEREVRCFQRGPAGDLVECQFELFDPQALDTPGGEPDVVDRT